MDLSKDQLYLLKELSECQNQIADSEYSEEDRKILRNLKEMGLVDLRWVTTLKGINQVGK